MASLLDLFISIGVKDNASKEVQTLSNKLGKGLQTAAKIGVAAVGAASTAIAAVAKQGIQSFAEYEQLSSGAAKIFGDALAPSIFADAQNAYKDLNMSANEYLATINDVGATFSATMGAEAGYETARKGLQAISDYATGTGKNVGLLSQKFTMITRSASSYQSIADQFSGVLPATSAAFLEQAKAAGFLEDKYKTLTEVPIEEYQAAVASMLEKGVAALNLTGNTANEAFNTLSGSIAATRAAWSNLLTGMTDDNADFETLFNNFVESATASVQQLLPRITTVLSGIGTLITQLAPILVEAFPALVESVLPSLLSAGTALLTAIIQGIVLAFPTLVQTATDIILTLLTSLSANPEAVISTAGMLISTLAMGLVSALPQIIAAAITLIGSLIAAIINKFPEILQTGNDIVAKLGEGIVNVLDAIVEAGSAVVESIRQGIAAAWDSLVSWFNGLWNSLFGNRSVNVGVNASGGGANGSNASGLAYVPFDNYISRLHQGEAVLNKEDARAWRSGYSPAATQPTEIVLNLTTEIDGAIVARRIYSHLVNESERQGPQLIM